MSGELHLDHGPVVWPAIVVHGGAGTYTQLESGPPGTEARLLSALGRALDAGWELLAGSTGDPVAAVVAAVESLENDGQFNAGRGSVPTTGGTVEMDAAVMEQTGRAGAVACITGHAPVRAAEAVLRLGGPVLLAGPQSDAFAEARGVPGIEPLNPAPGGSGQGTVGAVAVTADGRFAAATSTGGRRGQLPGRVGDTPIPGAGLWAEPAGAVAATGAGEAFLMAGFSRLVAGRHSAGATLREALRAGLDEVARYGGEGGGIALGADRTWAAAFDTRAMPRGMRDGGGGRVLRV